MSKVIRFDDLRVWKRARQMVGGIYDATSRGRFSRDFTLKDQIRRAAVSVPSNIAEGFSRRSNREFVQFLFIAKGSAAEIQSQLHIAKDLGYVSECEFDKLYSDIDTLSRQVSRFITYLKGAG
jgi:four helix bundle protein